MGLDAPPGRGGLQANAGPSSQAPAPGVEATRQVTCSNPSGRSSDAEAKFNQSSGGGGDSRQRSMAFSPHLETTISSSRWSHIVMELRSDTRLEIKL